MSARQSIGVIGAGYSSLSAACYLAKAGHEVCVYEKNTQIGGRSRQLKAEGFTFDMGPTWYWMPDVFDRFFADFGKSTTDYYQLERTSPSYRVYFGVDDYMDLPTDTNELLELFEQEEVGAGKQLEKFLAEARSNYNIAVKDLVYKPGVSPLELVTRETAARLNLFVKSISKDVAGRFRSMRLRRILEFPVLFLGAKPSNTPAFYSFMNYADMMLGTWHPKGGMFSVAKAMNDLALELGVKIETNAAVNSISVSQGQVIGLEVNGLFRPHDSIVSGADYVHTESLLPVSKRQYSSSYWNKRTFAPSALLFYLGVDKPLPSVLHHCLFFDVEFEAHADAIYSNPAWPEEPLFYASFPSKTDTSCAPEGKECCIMLVPLAPGLKDTEALREKYYKLLMSRMKALTGEDFESSVVYKSSYCVNDFVADYNSFKGNAYGLANTLRQTAFMRPGIRSKKLENLYFTGQLTVPGPGVPPALISGKIAAERLLSYSNKLA